MILRYKTARRKPVFVSSLLALATGLLLTATHAAVAQTPVAPLPTTPYTVSSVSLLAATQNALTANLPVTIEDTTASSDYVAEKRAISAPVRFAVGFFSLGGYFLTNSSGKAAIGDVKFSGTTGFYVRPKRYGKFELTGGAQIFSANDHFFPFTGGDEFTLIGPTFRVSTLKSTRVPRILFTGGLYYGHLRSEQMGFDRAAFTPSMSLGIDYPAHRYVTVYAGYRVSQEINGVNTDGFNVGFKFF